MRFSCQGGSITDHTNGGDVPIDDAEGLVRAWFLEGRICWLVGRRRLAMTFWRPALELGQAVVDARRWLGPAADRIRGAR